MAKNLPKFGMVRPARVKTLQIDFNFEVNPPYLEISAPTDQQFAGPLEPAYALTVALQNLLFQEIGTRAGVLGGSHGEKKSGN